MYGTYSIFEANRGCTIVNIYQTESTNWQPGLIVQI